MFGFLIAIALSQFPVVNGSKPPLEANATLEGQDALNGNLGTLGFQDGFGFTYRHLGPPREGHTDSFLAAWAPFSFLTLGAGVEYVRSFGETERFVQGSVALAVRPMVGLSLAIAYRPFAGMGMLHAAQLGTWDFGLALRPARWLSLTGAIEQFNQPFSRGFLVPRTYALGAAVRPFRNDWLTLGADVRLRETSDLGLWPAPRFTVDIRPLPFLGLLLAATTRGELFAGLSLRSRYVEAGGGVGTSREQGLQSSYAYARFSSVPKTGLHFGPKLSVQLGLRGDLRPTDAFSIFRMAKPQFGEIPLELNALARDPNIQGVRLVFQGFDCGFATLQEIRSAIADLRAHGKWVVAELGDADDRDLYVASAADIVLMEPAASLRFDGLKATLRGFKGALDKLGVRVEAQASGEYKNAPDAFTKDQPSSQQLEAQNALLDGTYAELLRAVSEGRKLETGKAESLVSRAVFTAQQAKDAGLIDDLTFDPDPAKPARGSRYENLVSAGTTHLKRREWNEPPAVALVHVEGTIASGESFEDPFGLFPIAGAATIVRSLEDARLDDNVKAVVVRINSPGGDVLASDFIWQAMRRVQATKPLIVSMGDVAASGGYYAALPADVIFAQPDTLTGSIGVFSVKVDLSGLFEKIGIRTTTLTRGAHADALEMDRPLRPDEQTQLEAHVQELYQAFLRKVAHARRMDLVRADAVARGRIWSGRDAHARGLVDRLGGVMDAIAEARRRAGYENAAIVSIKAVPALGSPLQRFAAEVQSKLGLSSQTLDIEKAAELFSRLSAAFDGRAMYLYPYTAELR